MTRNIVHSLLEADHHELDLLLSDVFDALATEDAGEASQKLDRFWARLAVHIRAEHLVIFPALLKASASGSKIEKTVATLRSDHDMFMTAVARVIKLLRRAADTGYEAATVAKVRSVLDGVKARLCEHNDIEESDVYGWMSSLGQTALEELHGEVMKQLKNMPQRFNAGG